jgi:hypothetical protein
LKNGMVEKYEVKGMANKSVCTTDWQTYCKLRKHVTKLNKKIHYIKNDSKKLWSTLNYILDKKTNSFWTKSPTDIANYFNTFFIGKISKFRHDMPRQTLTLHIQV